MFFIENELPKFMIIKACMPKDVRSVLKIMCNDYDDLTKIEMENYLKSLLHVRTRNDLITYPPRGTGAITITLQDYECLASNRYINDKIVEFYCQYLLNERLTAEQITATHIFSSFFFERLTTVPVWEMTAQINYDSVETWTKNVDLFEKEFIIVPINDGSHWFVAIICFPGIDAQEQNQKKRNQKHGRNKRNDKRKGAKKSKSYMNNKKEELGIPECCSGFIRQ